MGKTLFDKIWDSHVIRKIDDGPEVLYIDRQFIHEVTSPQAFEGLRSRNLQVFRPEQITATADHNIPTVNQHLPIADPLSATQVAKLEENCREFGINHMGLGHENNGIVHVIGPELGLTQPGMTIVCGDSHTSTHGAFGSVAFGIGTSEVEMVMASQCLLQTKPKQMRISVDGKLRNGISAKDMILYIISRLTSGGGTGYFIEYAGSAVKDLTMEGRMTLCNMSIEMGARGGLVAPDGKTFDYLMNSGAAGEGRDFTGRIEEWKKLFTDEDAVFDLEYHFKAEEIPLMITYGTNPGMGIAVNGTIPGADEVNESARESFDRALKYMGFEYGEKIAGKKIDYVFVGSCTNGRIEDLRVFADYVRGRKKAPHITAWIVPGSKMVERQAHDEGLADILSEAGFTLRQPGCSACLAMNDDKVPEGNYCVSTSNRNFEGRQGPGARTLLAGPLLAAAVAVSGYIPESIENY